MCVLCVELCQYRQLLYDVQYLIYLEANEELVPSNVNEIIQKTIVVFIQWQDTESLACAIYVSPVITLQHIEHSNNQRVHSQYP